MLNLLIAICLYEFLYRIKESNIFKNWFDETILKFQAYGKQHNNSTMVLFY